MASTASSRQRTKEMMDAFYSFSIKDCTFIPPPFFLDYHLGKEQWENAVEHEYTEDKEDDDNEADSAEEAEDDEEYADDLPSTQMEDEEKDERENRAALKRTRSEL